MYKIDYVNRNINYILLNFETNNFVFKIILTRASKLRKTVAYQMKISIITLKLGTCVGLLQGTYIRR